MFKKFGLLLLLLALPAPVRADFVTGGLTRSNLGASGYSPTLAGSWSFTGRLSVPNSTTLPATDCDVAGEAGRVYFDTDAQSTMRLYVCEGTGGWKVVGGGTALTSATTTQGDTLTLTSDGTDLKLQLSRASADLIFTSPSGAALFTVQDSGGMLYESTSTGLPATTAQMEVNQDLGGAGFTAHRFDADFGSNWDPDNGAATSGELMVMKIASSGGPGVAFDGAPVAYWGLNLDLNATIPAGSPVWSYAAGIYMEHLQFGSGGQEPNDVYGLRIPLMTTGTEKYAVSVLNTIHAAQTTEIGWGRGQGTQPTNTLRASGSASGQLNMRLNATAGQQTDVFKFANSTVNNGADFYMRDRSNATERYVKVTMSSGTALAADRTLTVDVNDADRTLELPIGRTGLDTNGSIWWGDGSDSFDTGTEVCAAQGLTCVTTFTLTTTPGTNQTCAFDQGAATTYFQALCK